MIVDTGILYALIDRRDRYHTQARQIFRRSETKIVPEPVIVETDWLVTERMGVEVQVRFLRGIGEPALFIECPLPMDRARAADLVDQYKSQNIGYVDAVVVAIAERLKETVIATVDRKHFELVRPRHVAQFELLP